MGSLPHTWNRVRAAYRLHCVSHQTPVVHLLVAVLGLHLRKLFDLLFLPTSRVHKHIAKRLTDRLIPRGWREQREAQFKLFLLSPRGGKNILKSDLSARIPDLDFGFQISDLSFLCPLYHSSHILSIGPTFAFDHCHSFLAPLHPWHQPCINCSLGELQLCLWTHSLRSLFFYIYLLYTGPSTTKASRHPSNIRHGENPPRSRPWVGGDAGPLVAVCTLSQSSLQSCPLCYDY
jgi:hypothetical protein